MTNTGIFATPEELARVKTARDAWGCWVEGKTFQSDPAGEVWDLARSKGLPGDSYLNLRTGEFVLPEEETR